MVVGGDGVVLWDTMCKDNTWRIKIPIFLLVQIIIDHAIMDIGKRQ